ncbi:unnamed protein product [Brassica napus]|uniref:(rape) hypothetical protein n=1 Tax=Brassica napus TaxID=3708 RepID=A0A816J3J3_BRANA|nr:unnamed protein product [Brassica napus]
MVIISQTIRLHRYWLKGRKGRIQLKEAILSQTRVINFVQKDIGEMFPKWEFDVEDTPTENIIKLIFKKVVKEDSPRPQKKARKEAHAEASEEGPAEASEEVHTDIVDAMREGFGTCLKEIKYLSERVEAVEKKVGITTKRKGTSSQNTTSPPKPTLEPGIESVNETNAGRKSLPEDKSPDVPADASSSKDKAPEPSLILLDKNQPTQSPYTAKVIIPNKKLYPGYNPFAPIDKKKLKELADWLKTCPHYRTPLDKKPLFYVDDLPHIDAWINVLRKRMCFLDHLFAQQWRFNYKDFKDSVPDQNGLGRRLPVNYTDNHWIAMGISIPKRHIVVWDSICSSISPEKLDVARADDCRVYALKYIECHALGMPFSKKDFAKPNGKTMRDKMAVDIFKELPDAHEFENKDNDANLGAYEGRLTVKLSGMLDDLTISSLESLLCSDLLEPFG